MFFKMEEEEENDGVKVNVEEEDGWRWGKYEAVGEEDGIRGGKYVFLTCLWSVVKEYESAERNSPVETCPQ